MKRLTITLVLAIAMLGCAQQQEHNLSGSLQKINTLQVLDPGAAVRNEGITSALEGNYGKRTMQLYQNSAYDAKSAREISQSSDRK